jgi:hypothetical protein
MTWYNYKVYRGPIRFGVDDRWGPVTDASGYLPTPKWSDDGWGFWTTYTHRMGVEEERWIMRKWESEITRPVWGHIYINEDTDISVYTHTGMRTHMYQYELIESVSSRTVTRTRLDSRDFTIHSRKMTHSRVWLSQVYGSYKIWNFTDHSFNLSPQDFQQQVKFQKKLDEHTQSWMNTLIRSCIIVCSSNTESCNSLFIQHHVS